MAFNTVNFFEKTIKKNKGENFTSLKCLFKNFLLLILTEKLEFIHLVIKKFNFVSTQK